jgi:hypothetical protein
MNGIFFLTDRANQVNLMMHSIKVIVIQVSAPEKINTCSFFIFLGIET